MPTYGLKLYGRHAPLSVEDRRPGEYQFDASDDRAAVQLAKSRFAIEISQYAYARLAAERRRLVWEQGDGARA